MTTHATKTSLKTTGEKKASNELDQLALSRLFRAVRMIYIRAFHIIYGPDPKDWSFFARMEFGAYAEQKSLEGFKEKAEINGPEELLKHESKHAHSLPLGILLEGEREQYLVFRGTIAVYEWLRDFDFFPVEYETGSKMKVHGGFYELFEVVKPQIEELKKLLGDKKLYVCGHSLGAAMAVLSALELKEFRPRVITFAGPKIGNSAFAQYADEHLPHYDRFELKGDPVPKMPPAQIPFTDHEFQHAGKKRLLQQSVSGDFRSKMPNTLKVHFPSSYEAAVSLLEGER